MLALDKLKPLVKKRKRVGRGGSRGGTAGKGHKGQKARSGGKISPGFEGGQMPLYRRLPKRGFTNARFKKEVIIVNLGDLNAAFEETEAVTKQTLIEKGFIKSVKSKKSFLLKVLSKGKLDKKLDVTADLFSESARKALTEVGGQARVEKE